MMNYIAPESGIKSFTCPHCGVLARHYHYYSSYKKETYSRRSLDLNTWINDTSGFPTTSFPIRYSRCELCGQICLWYHTQIIYPNRGNAPVPNPDMPADVKKDYEEAANIYTQSPRGAAALLRLAIQKLCEELGGEGKNINDDIKTLVKKGLPVQVQQALDIVRVIGNNAVHPGQIDTDDPKVAGKLFDLLNIITDYTVSMPKKISDTFGELPDSVVDAIKKRDGK